MLGLSRILRIHNKKLLAAGLLLAVAGLAGSISLGVSRASAVDTKKDCDNNAIIHCGFTDAGNFISIVKKNSSGNGHSDLKTVYAYYGLEPADYDKFVTSARSGLAYPNGTVVVDGQTVATNVKSIGRIASYQGSGYFKTVIKGAGTYYGNTNAKTFAAGADSLPVMVMFNSKGVMQFAVLSGCGNPQYGTNVTPSYSCDALHKTPVNGKLNTYTFSTAATAAHNATVAKVVYDFGDGVTKKVTGSSALSVSVNHTYTTPGTYTAKVTVYVNLPGKQQVTVTSTKCQTVITVASFECVQLTGAFLDQNKMKVSFTVKASFNGGATFTGADFDFGDGQSQKGVTPNGTIATTTYTYGAAKTYNATATLHFNVNGASVTAPACAAVVTPTTPPTPECKPGVPVGSPNCLPPTPPPPPELPKTGAGNTIAIFAAVVIAGFMVYRQLLFRKHQAAFAAAERGTSLLPLGDPLSDAPLADTPLATPKRRTFRRKRQF